MVQRVAAGQLIRRVDFVEFFHYALLVGLAALVLFAFPQVDHKQRTQERTAGNNHSEYLQRLRIDSP